MEPLDLGIKSKTPDVALVPTVLMVLRNVLSSVTGSPLVMDKYCCLFSTYLGKITKNPRNGALMNHDQEQTWTKYGNIHLSSNDDYPGWALERHR